MTREDPGASLRTLRAPPGQIQRALSRSPHRLGPARPDRARWALAAAFLLGALAGAGARGGGDAVAEPSSDPRSVPHHLELHAPDASAVSVAGTWNAWQAEPLAAGSGGTFHALVSLPAGRYEYMFLVDGQRWIPDPRVPITRDDGFGQRNSVIDI